MNYLDQKINEQFPGLVVRKDLVKAVKGNAIVPGYVLEYLLGQYCTTSDEDSIQSGIETVREILRKHYVHRNEATLVKSTIRERGRHRIIDKVSVDLNEKIDAYEASFSNLGIKNVLIDTDTVKKHEKLLVGGVWCICDLEYQYSENASIVPYILDSLKPIQMSSFDFEAYKEKRREFTLDEWIDLLMQTIGLDPKLFDLRRKLLHLVRLVPFVERNFNLIELGPKGTGKSHIYSEFSPHGMLLSGGEVSVPKLFVNNSTGKIGLVGYWNVVAFDEFAGSKKSADKKLVDILKNYMANKSFSRGIETMGAEASLAFVGNTEHDLEYMLMYTDLFEALPEKYHDSAFLDRLHFYIPGWEIEVLRNEMFSSGYGFVVDYLAEVLKSLRNYDYSQKFIDHYDLLEDLSTRDRDGVRKTFSGLLKILYPDGEAPKEDIELLLQVAIEGRKRIKDQLFRIDTTYPEVTFGYVDRASGEHTPVRTRDEEMYPKHYFTRPALDGIPQAAEEGQAEETALHGGTEEERMIAAGESSRVEFKATLRWNLHSMQNDKRVEYSALKTLVAFLNTEGGTLFIGVRDDGQVKGLEVEQFENEDKLLLHFANMLRVRIGNEHLGSIHYGMKEVQGVRILRVDCDPSPVPVYLKFDGAEEFYMRNGPSSQLLTMSEVVSYTKKHFR